MPIVSVLMITYNHEKYVSTAIEGALVQKASFPFEIVIGEDCSTDKTREICKAYQALNNDTIQLVLPKYNLGMMQNFISTLNLSRGKYIALCEGDDYWSDPLKLQKQIDFMEANPSFVGCFHPTAVIDEFGNSLGIRAESAPLALSFSDVISRNRDFHTSSFLFRRDALTIPPWFKEVKSGDIALFAVIASKGKLGKLQDVMSVYRKHGGGITQTKSRIINRHTNRIKLYEYLKSHLGAEHAAPLNEMIQFHKAMKFRESFLGSTLAWLKSKFR